jgi:hypothetical protein
MLSLVVLASGLAVGNGGPGTGAATVPVAPALDRAWKGTMQCNGYPTWYIELRGGKLSGKGGSTTFKGILYSLTLDGVGTIRLQLDGGPMLGIYKWDGRRLILCCGRPDRPRPVSFAASEETMLWTLEPVK